MIDFNRDVIEASKTCIIIVQFFATWCGHCKSSSKIFQEAVDQSKGRSKFILIDVDKEPKLSDEQKVLHVPDIRFYFNGSQITDKDMIRIAIDQIYQ